jgi:hypothetical protein
VSIDEQHVALPKLYGAPAYARPPRYAEDLDRPFDPDELPIEAARTDEEQEFVSTLPSEAFAAGGIDLRRAGQSETTTSTDIRPRSFSIRAMAGRLLGGD